MGCLVNIVPNACVVNNNMKPLWACTRKYVCGSKEFEPLVYVWKPSIGYWQTLFGSSPHCRLSYGYNEERERENAKNNNFKIHLGVFGNDTLVSNKRSLSFNNTKVLVFYFGIHIHTYHTIPYHRGLSISAQNIYFPLQFVTCAMLTFTDTHLHPIRKLQFGTWEDEIESPLQYLHTSRQRKWGRHTQNQQTFMHMWIQVFGQHNPGGLPRGCLISHIEHECGIGVNNMAWYLRGRFMAGLPPPFFQHVFIPQKTND